MTEFKNALEIYNSGDPLSDKDLTLLLGHFQALEKLVCINPELSAIRLYVFMNLRRLEDIGRARKEK